MSTGESNIDLLDEQAGLLRWLVEDIFANLSRGSVVSLSCFEVLDEMVNCLLQPQKLNCRSARTTIDLLLTLLAACRLQEHPGLGVIVAGAETLEFSAQQQGKLLVAVATATATARNRNRGRSHVVVRVRVRTGAGVSMVQLLQVSSVGGAAGMDRGMFALSNVMEKLASDTPGHGVAFSLWDFLCDSLSPSLVL